MASFRNSKNILNKKRIVFIQIGITLLFLFITYMIFNIQVVNSGDLTKAISSEEVKYLTPSKRGNIYFVDKNSKQTSVAINKSYNIIYADPKEIQTKDNKNNVNSNADILSPLLKISSDQLISQFSKPKDRYEVLVKKTNDDVLVNKIKNLKLPGIYIAEDYERYYPLGDLGCHIIGFISESKDDAKKVGRYGIENFYNSTLEGKEGKFVGFTDAFGRLIRSLTSSEEMPTNGSDVITTIDKNIQYQSDQEIKQLVESRKAISGSAIVMDPITGKILAMSNYPSYDLNEFSKVSNYSVYKNHAIEDPVEIGSVMKVITMTGAIESKAVTPETTYIDTGTLVIDKQTIHNYNGHIYNKINMTNVLEQSVNTGAVYAQQKTGNRVFYDYLTKFKFNEKTGIDLPFEAKGSLSNLEKDKKNARDIYFATASYGHGILVTPIALARAYSAIANGGYLVNPYIVDGIQNPDGTFNAANKQDISPERIITKETANTITQMMVNVVKNGYGKNAKVPGYTMAGKTGTADVVASGKYGADTIQTFAGFFPANNPKVVMVVALNSPAIGAAASTSATYGFHNLAKFIIDYYNIPPTEPVK